MWRRKKVQARLCLPGARGVTFCSRADGDGGSSLDRRWDSLPKERGRYVFDKIMQTLLQTIPVGHVGPYRPIYSRAEVKCCFGQHIRFRSWAIVPLIDRPTHWKANILLICFSNSADVASLEILPHIPLLGRTRFGILRRFYFAIPTRKRYIRLQMYYRPS